MEARDMTKEELLAQLNSARKQIDCKNNWFEAIFNGSKEAIFISDENARFVNANSAAAELTGYSKEELLTMSIPDLHAPGDLSAFENYFNRIISGEAILSEARVLRKDGAKVDTEFSNSSIKIGDKRFMHTIARDVSERNKAQKLLKESEKRFRSLLDASTDWVWQVDMEGRYVYVSDNISQIMGYEAAEVIGKVPFDFMDDNEAERVSSIFSKIVGKLERISGLEDTMKRKDDSPIVFETNGIPLFDGNGEGSGYFGICRDITARKRAKELLEKSKREMRLFLDSSPDFYFLKDEKLRYLFINRANAEFFGKDEHEIIGKTDFDLMPEAAARACSESDREAIDKRESIISYEKAGDRIFETRKIPVFSDNKITGVIGIIRDFTEQKSMEARLQQAQKMEAIGTLAGGIAHDFNNILAIILGNTEVAFFDMSEGDPARKCLKEVLSASLRGRDLINQILLFSRKKDLQMTRIEAGTVARESIKMLRASIPSTVEIQQAIEAALPWITADKSQIQQMIINLCANAAQSMERGGGVLKLNLDSVELESPLDTVVGRIPEGCYLRLQVSDTGLGMPDEHIERIFEPFFTTKNVGKGTGLGLAVVHGIVKEMKGGIKVDSELGHGSTFTVYIPAMKTEPAEKETREQQALTKGTGRILFIDDEPMIIDFVKRFLPRLGYDLETCAQGKEAMEFLQKEPEGFDLVITDMTMPNMTGEELTQKIRSLRPDMPVVLCTGYSNQISEERARELGISAFLMKPFSVKDLSDTIKRVIEENR